MQAKVGTLAWSRLNRNPGDRPKGLAARVWQQGFGGKASEHQFETSTVVSTGSAPPRIRISRTGYGTRMPSRLKTSHSYSITSLLTLSMPSGSAIQKVRENFMPASANSTRMQLGGLPLMARGAAAATSIASLQTSRGSAS